MIKIEEKNQLLFDKEFTFSIPKKIKKIFKSEFIKNKNNYFYCVDESNKLNYFLLNTSSRFGSKKHIQNLNPVKSSFQFKSFFIFKNKIFVNSFDNIFIDEIFENNTLKDELMDPKPIFKNDTQINCFVLDDEKNQLLIHPQNADFIYSVDLKEKKSDIVRLNGSNLKYLKSFPNQKCTYLQKNFFVLKDIRNNSSDLTINKNKNNILNYSTDRKTKIVTIESDNIICLYDLRKEEEPFSKIKYANKNSILKTIEYDEEREHCFYLNDEGGNNLALNTENEDLEILCVRKNDFKQNFVKNFYCGNSLCVNLFYQNSNSYLIFWKYML